jgi:hypothetical protein
MAKKAGEGKVEGVGIGTELGRVPRVQFAGMLTLAGGLF